MTNRCEFPDSGCRRAFFVIAMATIFLGGIRLSATEEKQPSVSAKYRVFALKHISAQKGKAVLEKLEIGTVSQLPNSSTLLVTASDDGLEKASAILELLDSKLNYVAEVICSASESQNLPSNEQIAAKLPGNVAIGTFANPPVDPAAKGIIIDTHREDVIAISPAELIENIISAVHEPSISQKSKAETKQKLQQFVEQRSKLIELGSPAEVNDIIEHKHLNQPQEQELAPFEPFEVTKAEHIEKRNEANEPEHDKLFNELLNTLAEAKKQPAQSQKTQMIRPEPNEVAALPQPKEKPLTKSSAETEKTQTETGKVPGELSELLSFLAESPATQQTPEEPVPPTAGQEAKQPEKIHVDKDLYQPELPSTGKEELKINLPSKLNITDLLALVGKYMELDFMYDPKKVSGEVMLNFRGPIMVKDLYPLLESVLKFHNFVMTRKGSLVTIVPVKEALAVDPDIYTKPGKVEVGDVIITRIFQLQHIDTKSAKNLLRNMELGANIVEVEATKTLVVTEYAYRMARIEEMIEMVDKPGKTKKFSYRRLEYTLAKNLVGQVNVLAEQLGTVSITVAPQAKEPSQIERREGESAANFARRQSAARRAQVSGKERAPTPAGQPGVYLDVDERTNRILMIGLEDDLKLIEELIDVLDVEKQDLRTMRLYEIQNVGAKDVAGKLEELGIISNVPVSGTTGRITSPRARASKAVGATPATPAATTTEVEEVLSGEPQVIIIEATNSLLVNATTEQHGQIALIIGYVDARAEQASVPYVVYPLENQDPLELAKVLNQLVTETTQKQDKEGKITTTTTQRTEEVIVIIPDVKSYSLIVYANKKNQQWLSTIIKQLDEYRPQVLLDVTLVEISNFDKFQFDLKALSSFPDLTDTSGQTSAIMSITEGSTNLVEQLTSSSRDRFIDLQSFGGAGTGFYGDKHINLLLTAMQQKTYGRILARPKLLVNDNEEGTIKAEEKVFQPEISSTNVISGTGAGTQQQSVSFKTYTAGVNLKIQPHISKGNQLQLTITLSRTDFKEGSGGTVMVGSNPVPIPKTTLTSDVTTKITVPDGKTIILGGLEKSKQNKIGTKIPLLGDIPLIGGLFRSVDKISDQSRLYVFVKAHILRPGEEVTGESDIVRISKENRARFEKYEKEMQEYEDWPGIKPKPMDPLRVLEED